MLQPIDILILSNGPGELTTWVRPVVQALRQRLGEDRDRVRISLVLSPCPNASGREVAIAQTYREIDRIQAADRFFPFLLWGKTMEQWDWRDRGIVLFLGGDQFFSVVIGKRLGYRIVVYGEWETRWHRWVDRFGVMKAALVDRAPRQYVGKFTVVGDLMAEADEFVIESNLAEGNRIQPKAVAAGNSPINSALIGFLPGSKPAKLAQGVPLVLAIAHHLHLAFPDLRFVIPVAPTLDLPTLARFANPATNPMIQVFGGMGADLILDNSLSQPQSNPLDNLPYLKTANGLRIDLWTASPAHELLAQCHLCFTTVGANTAELGALAVPMIVLLPTQQLDAMRAWDGLPGLLANLPGAGAVFAKVINWWFLQKTRLLAWPNIWAGEAIVPELVGQLQPRELADLAIDWLTHPDKLAEIRVRLRQVRGQPGAAQRLAELVAIEAESGLKS